MALMMMLTVIASGVNVLLLGGLALIYFRNYRKIKASFTLGLIAFSTVLLVQKLLAIYVFFSMMGEGAHGELMFVMEAAQVVAYSILLWITWH